MIDEMRGIKRSGLNVVPRAMDLDMPSTMTFETFHSSNSWAVCGSVFSFVAEETTRVDDVMNAGRDFHRFFLVVRSRSRSIFGQGCRGSGGG